MKSLVIFIFIILCVSIVDAQSRYALLIGINNYIKPDTSRHDLKVGRRMIHDLPCCENDIKAINEILITDYGFQQHNIVTLLNEKATGNEIRANLFDMIDKCRKGDVFFLYFAGHGSQIFNKLSSEPDKMDETIVPADGIYAGKDIRDKEIGAQLQSFINKGVLATAVFECCHSGSMARGLEFEVQKVEPSNESVSDHEDIQPERNGALILGACQDAQVELARPFSPGDTWYSLFTKAFMEVMKENNANTSANDLINMIAAKVKNMGTDIIPSIAGNNERLNAPLFGAGNSSTGQRHFIIQKILPDKFALLQGGSVAGLEPGVELTNENKTLKLEVVKSDLSSAMAKVIAGNPVEVKQGALLSISRYAFSGQNKLNVCMPVLKMKRKDFFELTHRVNKLLEVRNIKLVTDISATSDYWLYYNNSKWYLDEGKNERELGEVLNMDSLALLIQPGRTIRIQLPVYEKLYGNIKTLINNEYSGVNFSTMGVSDYTISGTLVNGRLNYELVKTIVDASSANEYPLNSNFYPVDTSLEKELAIQVCDDIYKLGRVKLWLNIESKGEVEKFPYSLALKNTTTKEFLRNENVKPGEKYNICLIRDVKIKNSDSVKQRYIYVFAISPGGDITLLYPGYAGNSDNHLPSYTNNVPELPLVDIDVSLPAGVNHIFYLTSTQAITNPQMIAQDGVLTTKGISGQNPLEALISSLNAKTRSVGVVKAPVEWSIQKIRFNIVNQ